LHLAPFFLPPLSLFSSFLFFFPSPPQRVLQQNERKREWQWVFVFWHPLFLKFSPPPFLFSSSFTQLRLVEVEVENTAFFCSLFLGSPFSSLSPPPPSRKKKDYERNMGIFQRHPLPPNFFSPPFLLSFPFLLINGTEERNGSRKAPFPRLPPPLFPFLSFSQEEVFARIRPKTSQLFSTFSPFLLVPFPSPPPFFPPSLFPFPSSNEDGTVKSCDELKKLYDPLFHLPAKGRSHSLLPNRRASLLTFFPSPFLPSSPPFPFPPPPS